uniref:Putative small auxin-up RNA n=1 Tax=Helianthus annuus TaxID=4232 RepID=A0A251UMQ7_HELAN
MLGTREEAAHGPGITIKRTFVSGLTASAEEEFGYNHPMGALTIPCSEDVFTDLASRLGAF